MCRSTPGTTLVPPSVLQKGRPRLEGRSPYKAPQVGYNRWGRRWWVRYFGLCPRRWVAERTGVPMTPGVWTPRKSRLKVSSFVGVGLPSVQPPSRNRVGRVGGSRTPNPAPRLSEVNCPLLRRSESVCRTEVVRGPRKRRTDTP